MRSTSPVLSARTVSPTTKPRPSTERASPATITLYSGTTEIGTAVVGPDGQWSITLETDLPDGGHVLTATAVDANNNLSGTSNTEHHGGYRRAGRSSHYAGH